MVVRVHEENPGFATDLIDHSISIFKDLLVQGSLHRLKLILRFYANLTHLNYFSAQIFTSIISALLSFASNDSSEFFLYLLTSTIMHAGSCILPNTLQEFLDLASRPRNLENKSVLQVFTGQADDILSVLLKNVQEMASNGWPTPRILQVLQPLSQSAAFVFPEELYPSNKCIYFTPFILDFFNLSSNMNEFIALQEHTSEIIYAFKDNLELTAQKLEDLKSPEIVTNCILSELLSLASAQYEPVLFSSLLLKVSKLCSPGDVIDSRLSEAIYSIVNSLECMDISSSEKLEIFLAHFISNLSFCWNWSCFLDRTLNQSQELFLRRLITRLVRLSYHDMVKCELPEPLQRYLIPEPEPILRFAEIEESVDSTDSQLIVDRINSKASTQAMKALLTSKEICNSGEFLMNIFCESLFYQGAKSLQHITIYLERYMEILTGVAPVKILMALFSVWQKCRQRIELLVGKLIASKLIASEDLANFCLERLGKADSWHDMHSLEWKLLEIAVNEAKMQKFEVIELVCRGCTSITHISHHQKLFAFLRKFIYAIEEQQVFVIESTLPESITKELRKLNKLVSR